MIRSLPIETLSQAEEILRISAADEAEILGITEAEVLSERLNWIRRGAPTSWFLKKWRIFHGISVATYSRLTGISSRAIHRAINDGVLPATLEPITERLAVQIFVPLVQGFTRDEIRRASQGDKIHVERHIRSLFDQKGESDV